MKKINVLVLAVSVLYSLFIVAKTGKQDIFEDLPQNLSIRKACVGSKSQKCRDFEGYLRSCQIFWLEKVKEYDLASSKNSFEGTKRLLSPDVYREYKENNKHVNMCKDIKEFVSDIVGTQCSDQEVDSIVQLLILKPINKVIYACFKKRFDALQSMNILRCYIPITTAGSSAYLLFAHKRTEKIIFKNFKQ